jgi:hypothetical protein
VSSRGWVRIVECRGPEALLQAYADGVAGRCDARQGLMASLGD